MRKAFRELLKDKIVILDGATGTNLQKRGMPGGVCPEQWIIEHREVLQGLQREYVAAGSDLVYAPTFSGNRIKLAEYGLADQVAVLNKTLVEISREAVGEDVLVAGDMTMTGQQLEPLGSLTLDALLDCYEEQARALAEVGVDVFVVETMMSLEETRAAVMAIHRVCDLPVMVTMTFEAGGRTLYGTDAVTALITLQGLGIDAFGINCSAGPENLVPMLEAMGPYAKVPLIAKANAGLPEFVDGATVFPMQPEEYADACLRLLHMGAGLVGGCCGTTPEHIRALARRVRDFSQEENPAKAAICAKADIPAVTTPRRTWFFENGFDGLTVDMRICAGTDSEFCQELKDGDWDTLYDLMDEAMDDAPDVINIDVDAPGVDGPAVMGQLFNELTITDIPVSVSSGSLKTLEAYLIHFPGRALILDTSEDETQRSAVAALAASYGAVIYRR